MLENFFFRIEYFSIFSKKTYVLLTRLLQNQGNANLAR